LIPVQNLAHNLLNRQITSNYRRSINLNASPPPIAAMEPSVPTKEPSSTELAPSASTSKRKLRSSVPSPSTSKRSRPAISKTDHVAPQTKLSDIGGLHSAIETMLEIVALPLLHSEVHLSSFLSFEFAH
jgi:hypothetical protein